MATIASRQVAPPPRPDLNSTGPHRMAGMILTPSIAQFWECFADYLRS
jgi:hypothetical protein